mmetsp:Transcript_18332/g.54252  ORF Transcript_18332/g.54252 Transcript_18332/m.54252 type:complete len:219 (+) Transcript_18332:398-1054(+)
MKGKVRLGGCAGRSRHHTRHHLPDVDDGDGSALAARGAEGGELLLERRPERLHLLPRHRLLGRRQRAELWPAGERGGEGVDVEEGVAQRQRWAVLRLLLRGPRQRQRQRWAVLRLPLPLLLLLRRRLLVAARAPQTQDGMLARCRDAVLRQELPVALLVALLRLLGLHGLQPVPPIPDGVVGPVRQPLRDQKPAVAQLRHARRDDCVLAGAPAYLDTS